MLQAIETKALELYFGLAGKLARMRDDERGVIPTEYVVTLAIGVIIAIGIVYATLSGAIQNALDTIVGEIDSWIEGNFPLT